MGNERRCGGGGGWSGSCTGMEHLCNRGLFLAFSMVGRLVRTLENVWEMEILSSGLEKHMCF